MANEFLHSGLYGDLTKHIQLRFDAISEQRKQLFDNVIFQNYLTWDTPTIGLNFEELIGLYNITIAAATIGDRSKAPIIGSEAPAVFAQRVLKHAIMKQMPFPVKRKILELQGTSLVDDATKLQQIINIMWGDVTDVVGGVLARLDMIFLNALSNEGVAYINRENNPEGGVFDTIDYGMPSYNKLEASEAWTEDNAKTVDVFGDIIRVVQAAADIVTFDKILVSPQVLNYILSTKKVHRVIFGSDKAGSILTQNVLNSYLAGVGLPQFEVVRRLVRVTNHGATQTVNPWNGDNIVFVPAGTLGVIKNAYVDSELQQEPNVTYSNYGRVRVSQWYAGETADAIATEYTKAECYAMPVLTEIMSIFSMNIKPETETSAETETEGETETEETDNN